MGKIIFKNGKIEPLIYFILDPAPTELDPDPYCYEAYFSSSSGIYRLTRVKVYSNGGLLTEQRCFKLSLDPELGRNFVWMEIDRIDYILFDKE